MKTNDCNDGEWSLSAGLGAVSLLPVAVANLYNGSPLSVDFDPSCDPWFVTAYRPAERSTSPWC